MSAAGGPDVSSGGGERRELDVVVVVEREDGVDINEISLNCRISLTGIA